MNQPTYKVQINDENTFSFISVGRKGLILKVVRFDEIEDEIFNLGFGDFDFEKQTLSDTIVSDNGDMEKILATVVSILNKFLQNNPKYSVFIVGSTLSRTRLYQIAINRYYDDFSSYFEIFGRKKGQFELFQKNENYEPFLIRKTL
ncbi:DUF6934 family protein [Emticicia sp. SJ17W-69]|uniref:DUF6934 family protein n=1 Tax=Emticicia sp. SJ17W-69 TaxID=3421657 RepID=UPI003EB74668